MCLGGSYWKEVDTAGKEGHIPAPHGKGMEKCLPIASKTGRGFPNPEGCNPCVPAGRGSR